MRKAGSWERNDSPTSLAVDGHHWNGAPSLSFLTESQESHFRHHGQRRDVCIAHALSLQGDTVKKQVAWVGILTLALLGLVVLVAFVPSCEWTHTEALVIKGVSIPDEPTF